MNADDRDFIAQALRVAAEQYEKDADECSNGTVEHDNPKTLTRLSEQFSYQADRARTLAAILENTESE